MALLRLTVVVRPRRAEVLCQKLLSSGKVFEVAAVECKGYGRQKGHLEDYTASEYRIDFLPKVLVVGVIEAVDRDAVIDLICATCRTGRIGDGKVFFQAIDEGIAIGL